MADLSSLDGVSGNSGTPMVPGNGPIPELPGSRGSLPNPPPLEGYNSTEPSDLTTNGLLVTKVLRLAKERPQCLSVLIDTIDFLLQ